jgi:hypothetical protein
VEGALADVVPFDTIGPFPGTAVWQLAYVVIVRKHWRHYGDPTIVQEHWPGLVKLMAHLQRGVNTSSGLLDTNEGHGDWICAGPNGPGQSGSPGNCVRTPSSLTSSFYWIESLGFMSELAVVAGQPAGETAQWLAKHDAAVSAWHRRFYDDKVQGYAPVSWPHVKGEDWTYVTEPRGSQTSNAMALALGAPPDATTRAKVFEALVDNIAAHDTHLTVGSECAFETICAHALASTVCVHTLKSGRGYRVPVAILRPRSALGGWDWRAR